MEPTTQNNIDPAQQNNNPTPISESQSQPQMQTPFVNEEKNNIAMKAFIGILIVALLAGVGYWFWMNSQATVDNTEVSSEEMAPEDAALQAELNALAEIDNTSELNAIDEEF